MNYKKKIYWILLGSIIGFIIGIILTNPSFFGLCSIKDKFCFDPYDEIIGQPLGILSVCLFFISIILLFLKEQIFHIWSKFAIIFLPIAIVLVVAAPTINGALIGFDKESAALWLAAIFLITSLFIIAIKSFKLSGEGK